jgi:hypothetical protein
MNEDEDAAEAAGKALEAALMRAARSVEGELSRIVRTGEADLERLALRITETLARLAFESPAQTSTPAPTEAGVGSFNQIAAALARAAARGARFT